jgi:serine/threonine protein kinase
MTTRLRRLKELFFTARDLSGQPLASFLSSIREITLREELKALLAAAERTAGILDCDPFAGLDAPPSAVRYQPGDLVAERYRVQAELGEGGFGRVYLARDQRLYDREVVLKFPLAFPEHSEWLQERLDREAESLARLQHPGVVGIIDTGETGHGHPFLVMHYVVGRTLREELSEGRIGRRRGLRILRQVGRALGSAHRAGILHQDLKPENIVLQNPGQPDENAVIIDFGVASVRTPGANGDKNPVAGSPDYLAPERMRGEGSAASDIFSLGVIALEMLLGRLPKGWHPSAISLDRYLLTAVPPVSVRMRWALGMALAISPAARFASAEEFVDALARRRWLPRAVGIAAASLAVVAGLIYLNRMVLPTPATIAYQSRPVAAEPGHQAFPALSPDGSLLVFSWQKRGEIAANLYLRDIALGTDQRLTAGTGVDTNPVWSPKGRWIAFRRQSKGRDVLVVIIPGAGGAERVLMRGDVNSFAWFPDGSALLASVSKYPHGTSQWKFVRVDLNTGTVVPYLTPPENCKGDADPAFSPDGTALAFARYESRESADLYVWRMDARFAPKGNPRRLTRMRKRISTPQWSPDGKSLFFIAGSLDRTAIWRIASSGGAVPVRVTDVGLIRRLTASRSINRLAYAVMRSDSNIWEYALAGPGGPVTHKRVRFASTADENSPRFSPDGRAISFNSQRDGVEQVWLGRTGSGDVRRISEVDGVDTIHSIWNLADGSLGIVSRVPAEGLSVKWLSAPYFDWHTARREAPEEICSTSRDGNWIYYTAPVEGEARLFKRDVRRGTVRRVTQRPCRFGAESPDGKAVYFSGKHESDGVWKVPPDGGPEVRIVPTLAAPATFAAGRRGLYYLAPGVPGVSMAVLRYRRFADGGEVDLATLDKQPAAGMALSPDERQFLIVQYDIDDTDIALLEGW